MIDLTQFDKTKFTNTPYCKRVEKPWGYELIFGTDTLPYASKVLHLTAGSQISLQVHDKKLETQTLINGRCLRIADNETGEIIEIEMQPLTGYTNEIGQRHRVKAITDCDIFESSTPEVGTTYRLSDDYQRTDETQEQRKKEREESHPNL